MRSLSDRLKVLIRSPERTAITLDTLLIAARTFAFERVAAIRNQNWDGVLLAIKVQFGGEIYSYPLDHASWLEAIDVARAILALNPRLKNFTGRYRSVAELAKRLRDQNLRLHAESGKFIFAEGELKRATQLIFDNFFAFELHWPNA